jgi:hypothetical protein
MVVVAVDVDERYLPSILSQIVRRKLPCYPDCQGVLPPGDCMTTNVPVQVVHPTPNCRNVDGEHREDEAVAVREIASNFPIGYASHASCVQAAEEGTKMNGTVPNCQSFRSRILAVVLHLQLVHSNPAEAVEEHRN